MSIFDLTNEQIGKLTQMLADAGMSATDITTTMDSLPATISKAVEKLKNQNAALQENIDLIEKQEDSLRSQGEWAQAINDINLARITREKNNLKMLRDQGLITQEIYENELLIVEAKKEQEEYLKVKYNILIYRYSKLDMCESLIIRCLH